jgi:hypothetical protein
MSDETEATFADVDNDRVVLESLDAALEQLRAACHAAFDETTTPQLLYDHCGVLVEILGRLQQLTVRLSGQIAGITGPVIADEFLLASDDDVDPGDYIERARRDLVLTAAGIRHALRLAEDAHSALSHLRYEDCSRWV